ncbi:MAG TPA: hypothetical protein VNN62_00510 [Methylomirabilota bacterium]|nr:hypothetical protein [Methylomirabilota bacterium]
MVTHNVLFLILLCIAILGSSHAYAAPPDATGIPDAPTAVPGSLVPTDGLGVRLLSHRGEWTSFFSMSGGSEPILLINGRLENAAEKPLTYVKLQFELLGENDIVVFRDYGYNRKAEALREEAYEVGNKAPADMGVERIAAGAQDDFRFIFFKNDVPEFRAYRIRVLEAQ